MTETKQVDIWTHFRIQRSGEERSQCVVLSEEKLCDNLKAEDTPSDATRTNWGDLKCFTLKPTTEVSGVTSPISISQQRNINILFADEDLV